MAKGLALMAALALFCQGAMAQTSAVADAQKKVADLEAEFLKADHALEEKVNRVITLVTTATDLGGRPGAAEREKRNLAKELLQRITYLAKQGEAQRKKIQKDSAAATKEAKAKKIAYLDTKVEQRIDQVIAVVGALETAPGASHKSERLQSQLIDGLRDSQQRIKKMDDGLDEDQKIDQDVAAYLKQHNAEKQEKRVQQIEQALAPTKPAMVEVGTKALNTRKSMVKELRDDINRDYQRMVKLAGELDKAHAELVRLKAKQP